ncbi:MAG: hypothetical protein ABFS35_23975 [Bacteroidota bacterium]
MNKYLEQFEAYQNGDMNPEEIQAFLEALEHDQEMLIAWNEYLDMMDAFSDKEAVSLRGKLEGAFYQQQDNKVRYISQSKWFRLTSAALVIAVMGALLYFFCANNNEFLGLADNEIEENTDSINITKTIFKDSLQADTIIVIETPDIENIITPEKQTASIYDGEQYQISPVFAELLNNVYRSSWFKLNTPEDSAMFFPGDSLVFSWETNIEDQLYFDILDRNGQVIYKHPNPISSPWTYRPDLVPAIYMFRFATEDQPVWLGVMVGG